jgi:predicted lipid-binding transport protein (Tim44 family)
MFVFAVAFFFLCSILAADSLARVGGGFSSGSRGSRSYSSPFSSSPMGPSQSGSSPFGGGGLFRGMMGGMLGGFLGSMLFRGFGGGGGIGPFEIILLAFILYLVYRFVRKRREQSDAGGYYRSSSAGASDYRQSSEPAYTLGEQEMDTETGLNYIRRTDRHFDEARFGDACMDAFFRIQGAWANRDMSSVRDILTDEMGGILQGDAEKLKREKRINKLDNIAVRSTDISEAWQESGKDYITVRFYANLLDYTVDEATGQVVAGSKTDPVKFEEYWTFTRPSGPNRWQLSAITQPQ